MNDMVAAMQPPLPLGTTIDVLCPAACHSSICGGGVAPPPPAGAPPPAEGLKQLKVLWLNSTQITDAGCATLAAALNSGALPVLERLYLIGTPASATAKDAVHEVIDARARVLVHD